MGVQENKSAFGKYFTPVTGPIYVAIISGFLVLAGTIFQKYSEMKLDRIKNQQELIKMALKENNLLKAKAKLEFYAKTGLIPDDSTLVTKAINDGSIDNIINPFKIIKPKNGDTIDGSKFFEISGMAGFTKSDSNFIVLLRDPGFKNQLPYFYPTGGHAIISKNGKWFLQASTGIKGTVNICVGTTDSLSIEHFNQDSQGKPLTGKLFPIFDFITVYIK